MIGRRVNAPRGNVLSCKGWEQEAALRMLMNNLDPEVAEDPDRLVVYAGNAKAARTWEDFDMIVNTLRSLSSDETLIVQSGKPVGVFETFESAPRVLIVNGFIVPRHASFEKFTELEAKGLTMFGGFTAGSWIYIGAQGIIQGTYETFAAIARQVFKTSSLKRKLVLTSGLGGMGRAQPLAISMSEGVGIIVEVCRERIERCIKAKFLDTWTDHLDEALKWADEAMKKGTPISIGLLANAADIYPEFVRRKIVPEVVTDQTSAHDELWGYVPSGVSYEGARESREKDPKKYKKMALESIGKQTQAMKDLKDMGAEVFEYGNWIRAQAKKAGVEGAMEFFPGFIEAYIRELFCEGRGPFRWVALSGDPRDIHKIDEVVMKSFPRVANWIKMAQALIPFQGLPARTCWLGHGERAEAGLLFNKLVKKGEVKAPIVFGRDHLDCGSVASPSKQTGNMKDGSDVIGDWPILKGLLNVATGATWVSIHQMWDHMYSSGMVIVADGTQKAEKKLKKTLTGDTGLGVASLADAGYEIAIRTAKEKNIRIPHLNKETER